MGKRGDRSTSGYHVNAPPKDKFDPNWRPRRGGKKARKQKELFERKYKEYLQEQGIPNIDPATLGEIESDDSGFPDFPFKVADLEEVGVVIEEEEEEPPTVEASSSSVPSSVRKVSPESSPKSSSAPVLVSGGGSGSSSSAVPVPLKAPSLETSKVSEPAIPLTEVPEPTVPPKAGVVPRGSLGDQYRKASSLSAPLLDLTRRDPAVAVPPLPPAPELEVRVSIDYNNTLNVVQAGGRQSDRIDSDAAGAIRTWLKRSPTHKVGICSYIGTFGDKSQSRRESLTNNVQMFNRWLAASGIPVEQLVSLCITSKREKPMLKRDLVTAHLDDKWQVIEKALSCKVFGVLFDKRGWRGWTSATRVQQFLEQVDQNCTPREFAKPFFEVP
eukprot:s497_g39.t1